MSAEVNKAVIRRVIDEMFNEGNMGVADELLAPEYVDHDPSMPEDIRGPEGFKEYVAAFRAACSDLHVAVEALLAEGDMVAARGTATGTHDGDLAGIPPTGKRITLPGMEISRVSGGKVHETWEGYDSMNLMQQLGVIPAPEEAEA